MLPKVYKNKNGDLKSVIAQPDDCVECGNCVDACPTEAITLD